MHIITRMTADGGIGIAEMLFCTSLVALVGAGEQPAFSPRRLQIMNTKVRGYIDLIYFDYMSQCE